MSLPSTQHIDVKTYFPPALIFDALTMFQFDNLRSDALTVSRIRRLLRPLEMKLNTLAKILNKHYAMPEATGYRESGATYSKKHRLRGFVVASARRGPKAWASLFDNHPLSSVYGFIEATVAVEDAFRHLVLAVAPLVSNEPLLSLQAITSKMIGRHIAEETLGRSAASEEEKGEESSDSEADILGDWYEEIPVHCRRDALVAHAVQLIIFKIPVFLLELWSSLLQICLSAGLQEESSIFLEHIVQYYFSPHRDSNGAMQCPINEPHAVRQVTQLYSSFAKQQPAATFFKILFSTFYELEPAVWTFRAVSHLYRHIDQDFHLSVLFVNNMARHLSLSSGNFQISSGAQVLEKLVSRTHDLIQRFPHDLLATSRDLLLDLAEGLGTLVNSCSVDLPSTEIGEALLTLCLTTSLINEVRHSEILHTLKSLEKDASPRIFTSLVLRTSLANFDHTIGWWLSILRSHHLINLAKALEHAVASFHAGDVPHRRPYKRKRKASLESGPSHDSDEWDHHEKPGRGKTRQTKVEVRNDGTPSVSSVSLLEDLGWQKRAKCSRVKIAYQLSEESGTEDGSPVHTSDKENSSEVYDQDKEAGAKYKPFSRSAKKKVVTQPLESSRKANAQRSTGCQPPTRRGRPRSRSKAPLPRPKQIIESSQFGFTASEVRPVSGLRTSSTSRQETHRSHLSSDDDLNLFACSSPQ